MNRTYWISVTLVSLLLFFSIYGRDIDANNQSSGWLGIIAYVMLYFAVKEQFKLKLKSDLSYRVTFAESFKISILILFPATLIASMGYALMPDNRFVQMGLPRLAMAFVVWFVMIIMGALVSLFTAYRLPRIKIRKDVKG